MSNLLENPLTVSACEYVGKRLNDNDLNRLRYFFTKSADKLGIKIEDLDFNVIQNSQTLFQILEDHLVTYQVLISHINQMGNKRLAIDFQKKVEDGEFNKPHPPQDLSQKQANFKVAEQEQFINLLVEENTKLKARIAHLEAKLAAQF